jgi:hypothetical protein
MTSRRLVTTLALALLVGGTACGDDDPSTSTACKDARKKYILAKSMIDRSRELGYPASYVQLDAFKSDHWECFK